jgi:hypothetical protein
MVTKCANPPCRIPFRSFREGKLFLFDVSHQIANGLGEESSSKTKRNHEYFWLWHSEPVVMGDNLVFCGRN